MFLSFQSNYPKLLYSAYHSEKMGAIFGHFFVRLEIMVPYGGFTAVAVVVSRSIVRNGLVLKPHQHWLPLFLRFSSIKITTRAINMEILLFPHSCSSVKFCTPLSLQQAGATSQMQKVSIFPFLIYGLWRNEYPPFKINTALALTLGNVVLNPPYPVIYLVSGMNSLHLCCVGGC